MSARVLVVDDYAPNVALLETWLTAEYFEVLTASSGPQAIEICVGGRCDIVLLDVMMPGMDGLEVCRRLKRDPRTHHIPIVLVTALDQPADRVRGLEAGAEDFLTKPIDEIALIARVRSLSRLKVVLDELRVRAASSTDLGMPDPILAAVRDEVGCANVLVVEDKPSVAALIGETLAGHSVTVERDPQDALFKGVEGDYDLFVISLGLNGYDGLRLCSQLRSIERTRHVPILVLAEADDRSRLLRGLDLGVNDYVMRPIDRNELLARARTQLRRKRYADRLRHNVQATIEMAVFDTLTGLHNRRFFNTNVTALIDQAGRKGRPLSLMILDIDHFKRVNDSYGHDAGDQILRIFAGRMRRIVRAGDLICRLGGEEFAVVMPDTPIETAMRVAERVRRVVEAEPFAFDPDRPAIAVTVSVGLAERNRETDADALMRRADHALYLSKDAGRNRVTTDVAAAA